MSSRLPNIQPYKAHRFVQCRSTGAAQQSSTFTVSINLDPSWAVPTCLGSTNSGALSTRKKVHRHSRKLKDHADLVLQKYVRGKHVLIEFPGGAHIFDEQGYDPNRCWQKLVSSLRLFGTNAG
jgi:hypothetical protein